MIRLFTLSSLALMLSVLSWMIAFTGASSTGLAQQDGAEFVIGKWKTMESKILGETRKLIVSVPNGYSNSEKEYPVLYLLDGRWNFQHTTAVVEFLASQDVIPKMIVVGIANTNRTRDLTPKPQEPNPRFAGAGGANTFLRVIKEELIPFVEKNYRTAPLRILVGHSFGGLFGLYAMTEEPGLFDGIIAISPSLQWDDQRLVGKIERMFESNTAGTKNLYITAGNEGGKLGGGVMKLNGILVERSPAELKWNVRVMEEETHGTVPFRSTRQGLEFIFRNWSLRETIPIYDAGGTEAIRNFFERAESHYGIPRPLQAKHLSMLAFQLTFAGRMDDAVKVLEHDLENYPPESRVYEIIAFNYQNRGQVEQAIKCYQRALEINPNSSTAKKALNELSADE